MRATTRSQRGTSLIETLIATAICTTVMFGLAGTIITAMKSNKNQGATLAQATTLAAQKLDQLKGKAFTDTLLTAGGSLTGDTTNYFDYLDSTGNTPSGVTLTSTDARSFFCRRWAITDVNGTQKQITVVVIGRPPGQTGSFDATSITGWPQTTLSSYTVNQ